MIEDDKAVADEPVAMASLILTHRALHTVPSLPSSSHLEKLDLTFNAITSLLGVGSCANLKLLSVSQNKLKSLKGIEGLSKLFVLNASKNKLRGMDEVKSLISLRALILNDNEISSISGLEHMKDLNTLVLSRNPISEIGASLTEAKGMTKLSLSNCRLKSIASSLTCCTRLRQLRLAYNEIESIPSELMCNKRLQILDLGNNLIVSRTDIKTALGSLEALRNLNLGGNLVMEKSKIENQVKKLFPNLEIFNSKPVKRAELENRFRSGDRNGTGDEVDKDGHAGLLTTKEGSATMKETRTDPSKGRGKPAKRTKKNRCEPVVDDEERPFIELFVEAETSRLPPDGSARYRRQPEKIEKRRRDNSFRFGLTPALEVGLGGSSMWEE